MPVVRDLGVLLRLRNFRRLLAVRLLSQSADGVYQVALATYVVFSPENETTPGAIASAMAVLLLPYSLIGPFAGVLLDRWPRRQVFLYGNLLRAVLACCTALLLLSSVPDWLFYASALCVTAVNRFVLAGLSAALPRVVDTERLVLANSLSPTAGTLAATAAWRSRPGHPRTDGRVGRRRGPPGCGPLPPLRLGRHDVVPHAPRTGPRPGPRAAPEGPHHHRTRAGRGSASSGRTEGRGARPGRHDGGPLLLRSADRDGADVVPLRLVRRGVRRPGPPRPRTRRIRHGILRGCRDVSVGGRALRPIRLAGLLAPEEPPSSSPRWGSPSPLPRCWRQLSSSGS